MQISLIKNNDNYANSNNIVKIWKKAEIHFFQTLNYFFLNKNHVLYIAFIIHIISFIPSLLLARGLWNCSIQQTPSF